MFQKTTRKIQQIFGRSFKTFMQNTLDDHVIKTNAGIRNIDAQNSFANLTDKEQKYAYYFSQACWQGARICYFQRSYESPALYYLFQKIYLAQSTKEINEMLVNNNYNDEEIKQINVYVAGVFQNSGNYLSFGDKKFIPEIEEQKFIQFIKLTKAYQSCQNEIDNIIKHIIYEVYSYQNPYANIGLGEKGLSSYYSSNLKETEIQKLNQFMIDNSISALNTRVIKQNDQYIILVASIEHGTQQYSYQDMNIQVRKGDFSRFLEDVNSNLSKCLEYVENDIQYKMIEKYIEHFRNGDIETHKDSQRFWIKDKGPIIETNIGFIEHYLDPLKVRAEWEGFVAIVDKQKSAVLKKLVDQSEDYIKLLPWDKVYENEKFNSPDFTALDIVSFGCSGTPIGINIPNYDEIREKEGYKNVDLQNAYGTVKREKVQFLKESNLDLYVEYDNQALFVIVALHELLGHGSGKLFQEQNDGTFNFSEELKERGYYKKGETFNQMFGDMSSGYEECKADSVALFLSCYPEVMDVLLPSCNQQQKDDILYIVWLEMVLTGIKGLRCYDINNKQWLQAHCQAGYAIVKALQFHDPQFINIEYTDKNDKEYMYISIDRSRIKSHGFQAISDFLAGLQKFKSTANVQQGTQFFEKYSEVDQQMVKIKSIIEINKQPRSIELQPSVSMKDGQVVYNKHSEDFEGVIESHVEHYQGNVQAVYEEWLDKMKDFRLIQ